MSKMNELMCVCVCVCVCGTTLFKLDLETGCNV